MTPLRCHSAEVPCPTVCYSTVAMKTVLGRHCTFSSRIIREMLYEIYTMKKSDFLKRNNLFLASCAGECLKWCTSQDYTYYPNYPISYLWAYGNMSRAFVVESNMMCEGYNPSNGKYSKILLVIKHTHTHTHTKKKNS